jgi:Na+-driven multidrug efflux pump
MHIVLLAALAAGSPQAPAAGPKEALDGIDPVVLRETLPYLDVIVWSTFPLLLFFAFRRYLQGMNLVTPVVYSYFDDLRQLNLWLVYDRFLTRGVEHL